MEVHIQRKHNGSGSLVKNYNGDGAASTTSDPGLSLKDDCSKYYYNNTLRRFMPISGSCIQSTNYSTSYNASNQLVNWVEVMERMLTLAEKTKRTFHYPPYHSPFNCPPPTGDYITGGPTPQEQRYMHTLRSCQATANNGYSRIYKSIPYEEVQGFRVDACPKCLDTYSIPIYKEKGSGPEELIKKMRGGSVHECRTEKLYQILNLTPSQKKTSYIKLQNEIRPCIIKEVGDWLQNNKACLRSVKLQSNPESECVHFRMSNEEFGFIPRAIKNEQTILQDDELIDFLLVCKFRSTAAYICIDLESGAISHLNSSSYILFINRST
jgi:hypothetical protein